MEAAIRIIECPRDAMQGLREFIPTARKAEYINMLLKVGFHTIDFGSFVSPKAIPQMADTASVLQQLDMTGTRTKLLAIVANARGAEAAAVHPEITYVGFPLSVSETFQRRNTNKSIPEALNELGDIKNICIRHGKKLVTYISMGFGNPYGDPYEPSMVARFVDVLITLGSDVISLADTVGAASGASIEALFTSVARQCPEAEVGVHLHATPANATEKIAAALRAGCRRIDGAMRGFGGCPMANDELVGNIATETIVSVLEERGVTHGLDKDNFRRALIFSGQLFKA